MSESLPPPPGIVVREKQSEVVAFQSPPAWDNGGVVVRTTDDLIEAAKFYMKNNLAPSGCSTAGQVVGVLARGADLGLTQMQALSGLYWAGNGVGMEVHLAKALVYKSGLLESIQSGLDVTNADNPVGWCKIKRHGQPMHETTFSLEDATRAGLWGNPKKENWQKNPSRMLPIRAVGHALGDVFPDVLLGMEAMEYVPDTTQTSAIVADVIDRHNNTAEVNDDE